MGVGQLGERGGLGFRNEEMLIAYDRQEGIVLGNQRLVQHGNALIKQADFGKLKTGPP